MNKKDLHREVISDIELTGNLEGESFELRILNRVAGVKRKFTDVNFKYCIFDDCYFNHCVFDNCDFTGCKFRRSTFNKCEFPGSDFKYASFNQTIIEKDILNNNQPSYDNLKLGFSRTLRKNFESIGDVDGVNLGIIKENKATLLHKRKIWSSDESYYQDKKKGLNLVNRLFYNFQGFLGWSIFLFRGFVWGHGESGSKLVRSLLIFLGLIYVSDLLFFPESRISVFDVFSIWIGAKPIDCYPEWYLGLIYLSRYIAVGMFMSILVKRFTRR